MNPTQFLAVCLGGALGTGMRYWASNKLPLLLGTGFPYATLLVNVCGSFLIGVVMYISLHSEWISPLMRNTLTTGIMGGLTTYSTFNYETLEYIQQGAWGLAGLNLGLTTGACLMSGVLGLMTGHWILGMRP